jgi:hypothetical protein
MILEQLKANNWSPWLDIDDAPKDGTHVDIWVEELGERYTDSYFCNKSNVWAWDIEATGQRMVFTATPPTHYMPLDTPEKLAQALKIAVEALEKMRMNSDHAGVAKYSLKQIDEVLK